MQKIKPAAFLLIKTKQNPLKIIHRIKKERQFMWGNAVYGPYQAVTYIEAGDDKELAMTVEKIRSLSGIDNLDARMCKLIPEDEKLEKFEIKNDKTAILLVNVNYKEEKERIVTYNLRKIKGVNLARAMWGPADIIVLAEARDGEEMRNLICDKIKTLKGVASNTTLYCYPEI
jgi:DNA-binding Lrp family transcriptional regulator